MHNRPILPGGRVPQRDRSGRAPDGLPFSAGGAATFERLRWEHNAQYHHWRLRQLPSCLSGCSTSAGAQPGWRGADGLGQPCPRAGPLFGDLEQVRGRCPEALTDSNSSPHGRRVNPNSGEHHRITTADRPAVDNRGVDADVYCVVLSSRAEDS
jgi:hypothetical protein